LTHTRMVRTAQAIPKTVNTPATAAGFLINDFDEEFSLVTV